MDEPNKLGINEERIRLVAKTMPHMSKIAAITSGGIKGSHGREIAILFT
jgi:hypothetical protein